jgi:hypothetical protein
VLLLAVPLHGGRMLFAVPPPIIRIPEPPFLRAVQAHLSVFRVRRDLPAVILSAAAALATGIATDRCAG